MNDEYAAMMNGEARGKAAFQGMIPSAMNAGGAPPPVDYAAPYLDRCRRDLSELANVFHVNRDEAAANEAGELMLKISKLAQKRRETIAKGAADNDSG